MTTFASENVYNVDRQIDRRSTAKLGEMYLVASIHPFVYVCLSKG